MRSKRFVGLLSLWTIGAANLLSSSASGQCETWQGVSGGVNDFVYCVGTYKGRLFVGGGFTSAGGQAANNIAQWDGSSWQAVGVGISGPGVFALAEFQNELVAGGWMWQPAPNIARWDGAQWRSLSGGLNNGIFALAVYNGELVAGGDFTAINMPFMPASRIARWNGSVWKPLPA